METYLTQSDYGVLILAMSYRITLLQNTVSDLVVSSALSPFADLQADFTAANDTAVALYQNIVTKLTALQAAAPVS